MAADPRSGVTDAAGRVHGVDNLYVGGSSLFPTSGFANPTLTIVALALRQADQLRYSMP
jgi:choline dehydrogenase-like flavoprotein